MIFSFKEGMMFVRDVLINDVLNEKGSTQMNKLLTEKCGIFFCHVIILCL